MKRLIALTVAGLLANTNLSLMPLRAEAQSAPSGTAGLNSSNPYVDYGGPVRTTGTGSGNLPSSPLQAVREVTAPKAMPNLPGSFVGSYFMLSPNLGQLVQNLVIPRGIKAVYDFGIYPDLNLTGNLINSGRFYAVSSNPAISAATISSLNIVNRPGAILTSVLPGQGIPGATNLNQNLSLVLNASQSFINQGQISSASNLTISAGNSIVNAAVAGPLASLKAAGDINLFAGSGSISNAGLIQSAAGNINVNAALSNNIVFNNTNGVLEALNGSINVRDSLFNGKTNLEILGGDIIAQTVNLNTGCGKVDVLANDVQGVVNVVAGEAHVAAATNNLILGNIEVSGDPAFYNTAANGDITIAGALQFKGQDLAIVAQRNILTAPGAGIIDTSSTTGRGGDITIIAGANVSASSSSGPAAPGAVQPTTPDANDANITLTITGGSGSGGRVDLTGGGSANITGFDSSSSAGRGGNVMIAAFSGSDSNSGTVTLPNSVTLKAGGAGGDLANSNGNVSILAGKSSGTVVAVGPIDTRNTTGAASATQTGSVNIILSQPTLTGGNMTIKGGTVQSGGTLIGSNSSTSNSVSLGDISIQSEAGMTISSPGSITLANLSSNVGGIIAAGKNLNSGTGSVNISTADSSGIGRPLQISAGLQVSYSCSNCPSVVTVVNAASSNGGDINLSSSSSVDIDVSATSGNANAGYIALTASNNSSGGSITLPANSSLTASGSGTGMGGNVTVIGAGSNITLGEITANRIDIVAAQPTTSSGYTSLNSSKFDSNGRPYMPVSSGFAFIVENFAPGTSKSADIAINGDIAAETRFNAVTGGSISVAATKSISGDAVTANTPGADIIMSATGITIPGNISASGNGSGAGGNIFLLATTNNLSTGNVTANGNSAGSIVLQAAKGSITGGALTASGNTGGNVSVIAANGISIGNIDTSASSGSAGYVVAFTGNKTANLTVGSIASSGVSAGGLVMLVNASSLATSNLSAGAITTDATGLDGRAGPVSIVSLGGISLSNISAKSTANGASTAARGGSVFISSGSTGATAINADGISIDTSATNNGAGDIAGNIILLTAAGSTGANPANISKTGATFTAGGGSSGTAWVWGLSGASTTVPTSLNVTPSASINITPGGYLSSTGSTQTLSLDTGNDTQIVVPISVAVGDASGSTKSLQLSSITQASSNAKDNIAIFTSGPMEIGNLTFTSGTNNIFFVTPSTLTNVASSGNFKFNAGTISLAGSSGVRFSNAQNIEISSTNSLAVLGDLVNTFGGAFSSNVKLNSGSSLMIQNLGSSTCCTSFPTSVILTATGSVSGRDIIVPDGGIFQASSATSYVSLGKVRSGGSSFYQGGGIQISSEDYTSTGDLNAESFTNGALVSVSSASSITVGNIFTYANGHGGDILLSATGPISALHLHGDGACCNKNAATVTIKSTNSYVSIGSINAANAYGGQVVSQAGSYINIGDIATIGGHTTSIGSSNIALTAGSSINVGNLSSFPTGCCGDIRGGDITMTAGGSINYGSLRTGFLNTYIAGDVSLTAGGTISGGTINTSDSQAGNVNLAASGRISIRQIDASHSNAACFGNCIGGNVIAMSLTSGITVNGSISTNSSSGVAGSVALAAAGNILVSNINTSSNTAAGSIFVSSGSAAAGAVTVGTLDSSSSNNAANSAGSIFLGANTAGTNGPSATGNANISFALASNFSQSKTVNPYLFYNGASSTINASRTINVKYSASPTDVDIFPGVYTGKIGSSGSPVTLTLDLGGNSRTLVPVISQDDVFLSGFTANNSGAMVSQKNGYPVLVASNGATGISLSGNISTLHTSTGSDGLIYLYSLGNGGNTAQSGGSITGGTLNIFSPRASTDLGSSGTPITATITDFNAVVGNGADLFLNATGNLTTGTVVASGAIQITASGNLTVATVDATVSANLKSSGGALFGLDRITVPTLTLAAQDDITLRTSSTAVSATSTVGDVDIQNFSPVLTINNSSGVTFLASNTSGRIDVAGALSGGAITLSSGSTFNALGGSSLTPAKSLSITARGAIDFANGTLTITPGSNSGRGADITLTSTRSTVHYTGNISSTPYGSVIINTTSEIPFVIGTGNTSTNGIDGSIIVNGTGAAATGGTVSITSNGSGGINLLDASQIVVSQPGVVLSVGGSITLQANNNAALAINLPAGPTITMDAAGYAGGAGGNITLFGNMSLSNTANLLLSVDGNSSSVSSIIVTNNSSTPLQIGSGKGQISLSGTGGGKTFSVSSVGALTVDMNAVNYDHPAFRTTIGFFSNGNLLINGDIDVSGSPSNSTLQSVSLGTFSFTPFTIGPGNVSANGITGKLIANGINDAGGSVSVQASGGINLLDPSYISAMTSGTPASTGGKISLNASSNTITVGFAEGNKNASNILTGTLSVDSLGSNSTFGSPDPRIDITSGNIVVNGGNLVLSANGGGSFQGGKINVQANSSSTLTVGTGVGQLQALANFSQTGGTGGQITFNTGNNNLTIADAKALSVSAPTGFSGTAGTGGKITISISGSSALILQGGAIKADGAGINGIGGQITLNVPSVSATANTKLSVDGNSQAGNMTFNLSQSKNLLRIGTASDEIQISASGGGGTIKFDTIGGVQIVGTASVFNVVNDNVYFLTNDLDYSSGVMNLGSGALQITLNTSKNIIIGGAAESTTDFVITASELANTFAGKFYIGNPFATTFGNAGAGNNPGGAVPFVQYPVGPHVLNLGDVTIATDIDFSRYGLVAINSTGAFDATGKTILVGNQLQVVESGDLNSGTMLGGRTSRIELVQWSRNSPQPDYKFNVTGPISVGSNGIVGLYGGSRADMTLSANIGGGLQTTIGLGLDAGFKQIGGIISGTKLSLIGQASMGSQPPQTVLYSQEGILNIDTRNLIVACYGDVYANNLGTSRLVIEEATVGGVFYLSSAAPIQTTGQIQAVSVVLQTNSNSNAGITLGSQVKGTLLNNFANATNHAVTLSADGNGRIVQTNGTIVGSSILLQTGGGNIGSSNKEITLDTGNGTGDITINVGTGTRGSVYVLNNGTGTTTLYNSQAGGTFSLKNSGLLGVNNIATGNGPITLVTTNGSLNVSPNSILNAVEGSLTLQTPINKTINIGANASLNASSSTPGAGDVLLAVGPVQKIANAPAPGSNVELHTSNGGTIYFGNFGISAPVGPDNIITADKHDVAFSTGNSNDIQLGGGVKFSARPTSHYLNSIDFWDPENVAQIQTLISEGVITGSLQVDGGIATGGNITIPQSALAGGLGLFAFKTPATVTVNFTGTFNSASPVNVNAGVCSNCTQVVQRGNVNFPAAADAVINLGMPNQNGRNNFMDSNKISAKSLTIYVKMDNDEFFAAPIASGGTNPYLDDCPNGKGSMPAPPSQAAPGPHSAAGCDGSGGDGGKSGVAGGASGISGGGGSQPAPGTNMAVNPKSPKAAGTPKPSCKKEKDSDDCDAYTKPENHSKHDKVQSKFNYNNPALSQKVGKSGNAAVNCNSVTAFIASDGTKDVPPAFLQFTNPIPSFLKELKNNDGKPRFQDGVPFDPCADKFNSGDVINVRFKDSNGNWAQHTTTVLGNDGKSSAFIQVPGPNSALENLSGEQFFSHYDKNAEATFTIYRRNF